MLTGNYALETGLRLGKQGQDGQGKLPEEVALEAHSPNNSDLPMAEAISQLQKLTPSGEELVTELKDPPLFMFSTTLGDTVMSRSSMTLAIPTVYSRLELLQTSMV